MELHIRVMFKAQLSGVKPSREQARENEPLWGENYSSSNIGDDDVIDTDDSKDYKFRA